MNTHVTCGHCDGKGACRRGRGDDNSCASCLQREGQGANNQMIVKCSVCGGTGWVKVNDG